MLLPKPKKLILLIFLLLVLVTVVACEGKKVENGYAQEHISFVEKQDNGLYQVWLRYDNVASYCFGSDEMYEKALWFIRYYEGLSFIHYRDIFKNDPEYQHWYNNDNKGCASLGSTSEGGGTDAKLLLDFCIMSPGDINNKSLVVPADYYCSDVSGR